MLAAASGRPFGDAVASAITGTHMALAYPPLARRLGEQGKVQLRLTISPNGHVTNAEIVKSSGFADLDQEAAAWVMAHWRYQPAIRGGVPVASTAMAAVTFDLENARRLRRISCRPKGPCGLPAARAGR